MMPAYSGFSLYLSCNQINSSCCLTTENSDSLNCCNVVWKVDNWIQILKNSSSGYFSHCSWKIQVHYMSFILNLLCCLTPLDVILKLFYVKFNSYIIKPNTHARTAFHPSLDECYMNKRTLPIWIISSMEYLSKLREVFLLRLS